MDKTFIMITQIFPDMKQGAQLTYQGSMGQQKMTLYHHDKKNLIVIELSRPFRETDNYNCIENDFLQCTIKDGEFHVRIMFAFSGAVMLGKLLFYTAETIYN